MTSSSLHNWHIRKLLLPVFKSDFSLALQTIDKHIRKETGRAPGLKIAFYTARASLSEIPELNIPELIGQVENPGSFPADLWRRANLVQATFTLAATDTDGPLTATVRTGVPDRREITFSIHPRRTGDRIGSKILNEESVFRFWYRGMR